MVESTQNKKLGPFLLSGLMIGPILGSGIIILPPLVYQVAGNQALAAWMLIVGLSFFFAVIFGRLSIIFPGDAGVARAIEEAFGSRVKKLTSLYLIGAVLFGPVAVLLTAAKYLQPLYSMPAPLLALPILLLCTVLLLRQVTSIGKISFILSTLVATTLFAGAAAVLLFHSHPGSALPPFSGPQFGYGLLLLFWTMVGWEVVGNYSGDVRDPETSIPRAVIFSVCIMALVSLTVAAAVQMIDPQLITGRAITITDLIRPLAGAGSDIIMAVLVTSLCITSYLLFTGGVARLISSLSGEGFLPVFLTAKSETSAPAPAILVLASFHLVVLAGVYFQFTDIERLVALADGFFIANALIGILSATRLLQSRILRIAARLLALIFSGILLNAGAVVIAIILLMAIGFLLRPMCLVNRRRRIH
ncbi:MAG TPA: amino acid permease [Desulfobulbaceae bacterium]|nr:amino acid permease [Desulfobulbaceae bacterium]